MAAHVALAVRFPDHHALAGGWDVVAGTLRVAMELPPPGTAVLVDGRVGEVGFLLGGRITACPGGERRIEVLEGAPVVEALLEPARKKRAAGKRAVA